VNVVAIIQARMGSSRLPGKVLRKVLGRELLSYQVERIRRCNQIDQVVIATTTKAIDHPIVEYCINNKILYYRGDEEDVLSRYYEAAVNYQADVIVRLTGDCPLLDPEIVDYMIAMYEKNPNHYVSNVIQRTFPRGFDIEIIPFQLLKEINEQATSAYDREHVTTFLRNQSTIFPTIDVTNERDLSNYRLTVDTFEDFQLIQKIIEELYPNNPCFSLKDVVELLASQPKLLQLNAHIEQKR
jgi:spore coat polysaccharide biosynthesis protein SpsF